MKIAILSNGNGNYSTKRLKEEAIKRGHEGKIVKYRDCYASIEHFFFPKFSVSAHPTALFAAAAQRTRSRVASALSSVALERWKATSSPGETTSGQA